MTVRYKNKSELYKELLQGSELLSENVGSTLGPRGHTVLIGEKGKRPIITKDGVTVAQFVKSDNPFEQLAIDVIKQSSVQTNVEAGDGTTTSTIIANAIFKKSQKYLATGVHPFVLKKQFEDALKKALEEVEKISSHVDSANDIENIAYISSNGDRIASRIIREAVESAGQDGAITIDESHSKITKLDVVEGFSFRSGLFNQAFVTDEKRGVAKLDNPFLLVTDKKISSLDEIMGVLEIAARANRPLVMIAEDFEGEALGACMLNQTQGNIKICLIKAPNYGEERRNVLEDLAISSGAKFFRRSNSDDISSADLSSLGTAKYLESNKFATIIVDLKGDLDKVNQRIDLLKEEMKEIESHEECKKIQERIARLASTVAIIKIGADTEIEMIEKRHRYEDALEAVVAAQDKGYVPGGGVTLLRISNKLRKNKLPGFQVFCEAIEEPFRILCKNSGENFHSLKQKILRKKDFFYGYDFNKQKYGNMVELGVIDPTKVTIGAIKNATSSASTLLTTSYSIVTEED